jgi:hypothetical protein
VADHGGQGAVALACALEQQGGTTTATTTKAPASPAAAGQAMVRARSVAAVLQDTDLQFCNATVRACRALRDGRDAAALDACSRALDLGGYCYRRLLPHLISTTPAPACTSRKGCTWCVRGVRAQAGEGTHMFLSIKVQFFAFSSRDGKTDASASPPLAAPRCSRAVPAVDLAHLHFNRAQAACRLQKHSVCMAACQAALQLDPSHTRARALRAEISLVLMEFADAADVRACLGPPA